MDIPSLPDCCDREAFTYVLLGANKIKIGQTTDVARRVSDIGMMSPVPLKVVGLARGVDLERKLHMLCSEARSHGEWFELRAWSAIESLFAQRRCASCAFSCITHGNWERIVRACARPHAQQQQPVRLKRERKPRMRLAVATEPGRLPLTDRQQAIFEFIDAYRARHGGMPPFRAIGAAFDISSSNGVSDHVHALVRKGWLLAA